MRGGGGGGGGGGGEGETCTHIYIYLHLWDGVSLCEREKRGEEEEGGG